MGDKKKKGLQPNEKGKAQAATSAAREVEEVDDEGFAYSAVLLPAHIWLLQTKNGALKRL